MIQMQCKGVGGDEGKKGPGGCQGDWTDWVKHCQQHSRDW